VLFALTAIPGALAVLAVAMAREQARERPPVSATARDAVVAADNTWRLRDLPRGFHSYMAVLFLFSLGNSTDAFLLLRLSNEGVPAFWIPLLWAALHVVKATVSIYGGNLSDRLSRRSVIGVGWAVYALVYAGFARSTSLEGLVGWFLVYGIYYGLAEGTEKALVADLAPAAMRGTAFGLYNGVLGVGALAASLIFGYVWKVAGAPAAFTMGASLALAATLLLFLVVAARPAGPDSSARS
jgi:MFS family permease